MRRPATIAFVRKRLPHWEVENGRYFVTLHRAGAIPEEAARQIRRHSEELSRLRGGEMLEQRRRIFREMETWLDRAESTTDLILPRVAAMLTEAIADRRRRGVWNVMEYVIMSNHLHLFFSMGENQTGMIRSVNEFKRWTGRQAAKWVDLKTGDFWEREWFDHWSRSPEEDRKIIDYIRNNPIQAGLVRDSHDWPWGGWAGSPP